MVLRGTWWPSFSVLLSAGVMLALAWLSLAAAATVRAVRPV